MSVVTTAGDAGDLCFTLCVLRDLPNGPHSLLIEEKDELAATGRTTEGPHNLLRFAHSLVTSQPYISECRIIKPADSPYWRSGGFRRAGLHRRNEPLMQAHLNHLNQVTGIGLKVDTTKPWLTVDPDQRTKGKVTVNRTSRYRNAKFPWAQIVEHYRPHIVFLGLPHEHTEFVAAFGPVEFIPTATMLEVAQLIKGSELFIGNQSCPNALAEGMKHNLIQEVSLYIPDCIFKRDNAQHVWDGSVNLPSVNGSGELEIVGTGLDISLVSEERTPPQNWQHPYMSPQHDFGAAVTLLSTHYAMKGKTRKEIGDSLKRHNLDRCPEFYRPTNDAETVRQARRYAGYPI